MRDINKKFPVNSIRNNRRRKVIRSCDIVTGMQTDHFKLKDLFKGVANTVLSPIKGTAKFLAPKKLKKKIGAWGYNNPGDFSNEKTGRVFTKIQKVTDVALPVAGAVLGGAALLGGGSIGAGFTKAGTGIGKAGAGIGKIFKGKGKLKGGKGIFGGLFRKKGSSLTPQISPLAPSGATTGIDAGLMNLNNAQSGDKANWIKRLAGNITPENIERAKQIASTGRGYLTQAQELFQAGATDPDRLPKTRDLKEAEQLLSMPQNELLAEGPDSSIGGIDSKMLMIIGAVLALVIVGMFMSRK